MITTRIISTNNDSILIMFMMLATNNTIIKNDTNGEENESVDIIVSHHCTMYPAMTCLPYNIYEENNNDGYIGADTN